MQACWICMIFKLISKAKNKTKQYFVILWTSSYNEYFQKYHGIIRGSISHP